eukprot:Em0004g1457a
MVYCFKLHVADVLAPGCDVSIGDSNVVDGADVNPPSAWKSQIDHSAVSTTGRGSAQSMYLPAIEGKHEAKYGISPVSIHQHTGHHAAHIHQHTGHYTSRVHQHTGHHAENVTGVVNATGVVTGVLVNMSGVVTGVLVNMSGVVTGVLVNKIG